MAKAEAIAIDAGGREVRLSNPRKPYFAEAEPAVSKRELAEYYVTVADAALIHLRERPTTLKRFVDGAGGDFFFQKRIPKGAPEWLESATVHFPSGRSARELCANDAAHLVWAVNLGVIDFNPWPCRRADLDCPDELRVDLDPTPEASWNDVREVALVVRDVLTDHDLCGFPKTSGNRGIHVNVRLRPEWGFDDVRRSALALAREVERRVPKQATSKWWKEERHGVFVDYNQNARDRTVASAYSVRPVPDARVSTPLEWDEVAEVDPARFTLRTVPDRLRDVGDPSAKIDEHAGGLEGLLALATEDEEKGLGDAPWPPHFRKQKGEPKRVQPSKAKLE
ncbi:MAG: DNA polymerase domain-containing protein [Solirubrobacterales bacterium]|nr:DNA polymerase domain-containing protein [Solirubrobacterales bacterium]